MMAARRPHRMRKVFRNRAAAAVFGAALLAPAAAAPCGLRAAIVARLGAAYGEIQLGAGLAGPAALIEVFAAAGTGTWTILRTGANGVACVLAAGQGWQPAPPPPPGDPS
jgi:hypothetical protein